MSARMDHKIHILVYIATVGMVTRVLDITSWSYGGFTAWNIVPFVNESWKLMLLNTLMFLPMGLFVPIFIKKIKMELWKSNNCRDIDIFDDRVCTSCICRKNGDIDDIIFNTLGFLIRYILENLLQKFF